MDLLTKNVLELFLFFISFLFFLKQFNALRYEELFKKGHIKEIQAIFIAAVLIFSYLFAHALISILDLSVSIFI